MSITPLAMPGTATPAAAPDKQPATSVGAATAAPEAAQQKQDTPDPRLAQLARAQKMLREQQRQLEEQKKALEAEKPTLLAEVEKAKKLRQLLKENPYQALLEEGITADQAASLLMNQPDPADQKTQLLHQEIQALRDELKSLKSGQEQSANDEVEAARKQILHDVKGVVGGNADFEAINLYGETAEQAVVALIEKTFEEDGVIIDTNDAAKQIEEYLVAEAKKAAGLKKLQPPSAPKESEKQEARQKQGSQTLTNSMVQSATSKLTPAQKRARAIAIAEGRVPPV
jgi:hypothetical protein